jgi:N utilization substance protein A
VASIYQSIEILSKEKGIDPQIVIDAVKDAMLVAARKHFHTAEDLIAEFNDQTGALEIYGVKKVVEEVQDPVKEISLEEAVRTNPAAQVGSELRTPKPTDVLGRISAQTAKQVILQKVREAERETIYSEYSGRVGELVNCSVKRMEGQDLVVDLGKTEARLGRKEQSRVESFSVGDRVRCVIRSVEKAGKNAGVIVSRAAPELVMRLFEQEVPEIYDNTVVIKGCAREAGERTKIAVSSRDRDVDSVGACVGMKGMRVQSIIRELRGEKIDIIEFSEDPVVFATHALSPAKISRVSIIDANEKHMEVIVDDTQLSLAIGKKGQNVRLAAKLLGWKIDIKSEEEKRQEVESAMAALVPAGAPVSVLTDHGLDDKLVEGLIEAGIGTVEKLGSMTPEELEAIPGIEAKIVEKIQIAVNSYYAQFEEAAGTPETAELSLDEIQAQSAAEMSRGHEHETLGSPESAVRQSASNNKTELPPGDSSDRETEFDTIKNSEEVS